MNRPAVKGIDEAQLAEIWRRHLRLERIDRDDDFFALGGSSLQAAQIFLEIEDIIGLELPITVLLEAPTIGELAAYIRRTGVDDVDSLVLLKPGGTGSALFLIHPVGGTVLAYRELAGHLSFQGPVYGVQAAGLVDDQPPHTTIDEMARCYCDRISRIQPEGPCLLAGYSAGGVIAFAMAQAMHRDGREVRFLGLINTHFPFRRIGRQISFLQRVRAHVRYSRDRGIVAAFRDFNEYLQYRRKLGRAESMLDAGGSSFEERHRRLVQQVLEENPHQAQARPNRYAVVQQLQQLAVSFYRPSVYPGIINLYKTADYHDSRPGEIGWERVAAGGIDSMPIPGTHLSSIEGDNAAALASMLSQDLESVSQP